jgi:hypothetical protein
VGQGAFNVARLIAELGLKRVEGRPVMELAEVIQPTITVGDLSGLTPPHVAPEALFGGLITNIALEAAAVEIQCLAPGGGFLESISIRGPSAGWLRQSATALIPADPVLANVGQLSRDPVVSVVRVGTVVPSGLEGFDLSTSLSGDAVFYNFAPRGLFIPRGTFLTMEAQVVNIALRFGLVWREVPASESVPS